MGFVDFFYTFRGRLLLILALMLIATLGVQYYLNLLMQEENNLRLEAQTQALMAGIAMGFTGITSKDRLLDLIGEPNQSYLDQQSRERIRDIIIINNYWQITDSLSEEYLPQLAENDELIYRDLSTATGLPPLMEEARLGDDLKHFPNRKSPENRFANDEAHAVPIETSQGRWYVMVLLKNDRNEAMARAAQPLVVTLAVLSVSALLTVVLVWRFTRPIADLSEAARRVAEGDLCVRVPDNQQNDEIGHLARRFNEMTAELEKSKALEDQLRQAEKSAVIGRLGSAIAHEIRNPLNYINLTLDHLRSKFAPEDDARQDAYLKLISQIKDEVARINRQISEFLNYSRPAAANLEPTNIHKVVEDSLRLFEAQAAEIGVKISVIEHEFVPRVMGDPEFLRSLFNNLFSNALQAMESKGGHLNIKIDSEGSRGYVKIEIADTGSGISPDSISKIFEPYFSTKETGTGLGLAIVQKIVDIHNGTIEVESEEGVGTKFILRLHTAKNGGPE